MANDTLTTMGNALKYVQRNFMADDTAKAAGPFADYLRRNAQKIHVGGKALKAYWSHKKYPGVGINVLSDGGALATPAASAWAQPEIGICHYSYAIGVTGHAEATGSGPEFAYLQRKIVKEKTEEIREKAASLMARFLMNDGTQTTFATVTSVSGNIITIESGSTHMFKEGEVIGGYDATADTDTTDKFTDGTVVEVSHQNGTVTVADIGTVVAGDFLAIKDVRGTAPPNGIRNLFALATGTVQGINRATAGNHFYEPVVKTFSGALTGTMVDQLRDLVWENGGQRGAYNSSFIWHPTTRQWATLATIGQNRYADMTNLQLGNTEMKLADKDGVKTAMEDPYLRTGEVFVVDGKKCILAYPKDMEGGYFVENAGGQGGIFFQQPGSSAGYLDAIVAYFVQRWNFGADEFRCQGYGSGFVSP